MSKKLRIIFLILAIIVLAGFAVVKLVVFKKSETSVGARNADIELDASALVKSFESDENASNTKYLNKVILVTGPVESVSVNKDDISIYLKKKDESSGVLCSFSKGELAKDAVIVGNTVSIKGICNGYLMDVVLNKCSLVK